MSQFLVDKIPCVYGVSFFNDEERVAREVILYGVVISFLTAGILAQIVLVKPPTCEDCSGCSFFKKCGQYQEKKRSKTQGRNHSIMGINGV